MTEEKRRELASQMLTVLLAEGCNMRDALAVAEPVIRADVANELGAVHAAAMESAAKTNAALRSRLAAVEQRAACDACGGSGTPLSGAGCICGGSGLADDAVTTLRDALVEAERERRNRVAELHAEAATLRRQLADRDRDYCVGEAFGVLEQRLAEAQGQLKEARRLVERIEGDAWEEAEDPLLAECRFCGEAFDRETAATEVSHDPACAIGRAVAFLAAAPSVPVPGAGLDQPTLDALANKGRELRRGFEERAREMVGAGTAPEVRWPPIAGDAYWWSEKRLTLVFDGATFAALARARCREDGGTYLLHDHQFRDGSLVPLPANPPGEAMTLSRWEQLRAFVVERLAGLDGLVRYERSAYGAILAEMDRLAAEPGERVATVSLTVQHYWNADYSHVPYWGMLRDATDDGEQSAVSLIRDLLVRAAAADGEEVEVSVRATGRRPFGDRRVRHTAPHTYEREPAPTTNEGSEKK